MASYFFILNFIIQIFSNNNHINNILNSYEVSLKVKGTGMKQIIYSGFDCPTQVYLNGKIQNLTPCYKLNVNVSGSVIKLIYDVNHFTFIHLREMFYSCEEITEIDMTNFDTSLVTVMDSMFKRCHSLSSLNISNFDTTNVERMDDMFNECYLLKSIDLSSFDTSSVTSLGYMFYECRSLTSINLTHFKTNLVYDIDYMFYNNYELTSIDLSNFNTQNIKEMEYIFYNCSKLEYINLKNFEETKNSTKTDMFFNIPKNVVICLDSSKSPNIYNLADNISCVTFSCENNWRKVQKKIDIETSECLNNCSSLKYEYLGKCYSTCPSSTTSYDNKCYPCDSDCKSCSYEENKPIGTICTSCYDNKFLNKGRCEDNCTFGYYEDDNDSSIKICKCEKIKCKICSIESLNNNQCVSCNDGNYPMLNDESNIGNFINCYNESIDGYYLDISNKMYKPCYYTCKTCDKNGNDYNHNCLECKPEYGLNISFNDSYNCYAECNNYYYFNNQGNYICLNVSKCPGDYNKLIPQKGQCIDDCCKDPDYPYEFRNLCYNECPKDISYESDIRNNFCEVNCTKRIPLEFINNQNCTDYCGINDMSEKICISKYEDEETNVNLILQNIKTDIVSKNFNRDNLTINEEEIIIEEVYTTFTITTNKILKNNSNKLIDLGNCENYLKNYYKLDTTDNLVILIINVQKNKMKPSKIVYEVYSELSENKLTKLDLNICKDSLTNNEIKKCSNFTIESLLEDSCISCQESFYPIYIETSSSNSFIKCYNNPEGFYLDLNDNTYKKCYSSCQTCDKKGNSTNHNCLKCNNEYGYELNINERINCYNRCEFYTYYNSSNNKYYCTSELLCPPNMNKLIPLKKFCIDDCKNDDIYIYEFNNICYKDSTTTVPEITEVTEINIFNKDYLTSILETTKRIEINTIINDIKCTKEYPFKMVKTHTCVNNCTIVERQKGLCIINYELKDNEDNKEIEEKVIQDVKEEMKNLNISEVDKGDIIIKQKSSTITISTSDNQKNGKSPNTTNIDLGQCEDKIKEAYNIPKNKSLYILKLEVKQEGLQIPKIDYEVYYPLFGGENIKLNLTACSDLKIDISIPASISDNIDKNNATSGFYNDICYTYTSEDGTDVSLADRKKEFIENNLTLCEENCDFVDFDYFLEKAICSCRVKTNSTFKIRGIEIDTQKLYESFTDFKNIANIKVLNCYKLIFRLEAYKNNYANLILIAVILIFFICMIIFCCKDYPNLKKIMNMIVYLKTNIKLVQTIINKNKKEKENSNNKKRKKNNINNNLNKATNQKKAKELVLKKTKNKSPKKKHKSTKLNIQNINIDIKGNPIKKNKRKMNNPFHTDLTTNNYNSFEQINMKFTENQIYGMAMKINKLTDLELNNLPYKEALKNDKRTFCMYYLSLIRTKHLLFFSFMNVFDYNSRTLKIFLFFFNFIVNFIANAFFFNEGKISKIHSDGGSFDFIYNIPQILYSALISGFVNALIKTLALSYWIFNQMKKINNINIINITLKKYISALKLKSGIFFIFSWHY